MSDEIRDWLTDLRSADPPAARLVGEALTALMSEGAGLGPPLVTSVTAYRRPITFVDALDGTYETCLEKLQLVRRRVADAATEATRLRAEVGALEAADEPADEPARHDELARLRRELAEAAETETYLTAQSHRLQRRVDAFRTRKETLKASYVAAQAEQHVQQLLDQFDAEPGPDGAPAPDAEPRAAAEPAEPEIARIEREIERELSQVLSPVSIATGVGGPPPPELLELRPGAPEDNGIRVLFGIEPPGTALLISVLEGGEALRDHYDEAVELSAEVLQQVRDGDAAQAAARTFATRDGFLGEFFPGEADRVSAAAADLIAGNRGRTLAGERSRLGLTQAQVAERMGVALDQVDAIEHAGIAATDVGTLAGYVRALGGRLEIIADFGGERVPLRGPAGPPS